MIKVKFLPSGVCTEVEKGTTILMAARKAGVMIESPCDGIGTCGKCKVKIDKSQLAGISAGEGRHKLSQEEKDEGYVLACQTVVLGDVEVTVSSTRQQNKTLKILSDGKNLEYEISPYIRKTFDGQSTIVTAGESLLGEESGDTTNVLYGVTVDIGTTTLVAALIDMKNGKEMDSVSALNPQSLYAQDVLTRIKFASDEDGLKTMFDGISGEINAMIGTLCDKCHILKENIYEIIYSGNTTMIHLAAGINPKSLGKYPYTPVLKGGCTMKASDIGIDAAPFSIVYFPPIISAYVGPDITSGVLVTDLKNENGTTLLIDIGTNGEMVIARDGALSSTSTAAGPAFEGMNITFGMRAGKGAIEYFDIDDLRKVTVKTIGDAKPKGICGSGLFDIVGELVRTGIITSNGRFIKRDLLKDEDPLKAHLKDYDGKTAFEVADGVFLTLKDIRQVQLAKGAVRAGVEALMLSQKVSADAVDRVLIAGSFGYHLRSKSLVNIGILPPCMENKIEFVGNTSKTGGNAFLLHAPYRDYMKSLVSEIHSVELANIENFDKIFVKAMSF